MGTSVCPTGSLVTYLPIGPETPRHEDEDISAPRILNLGLTEVSGQLYFRGKSPRYPIVGCWVGPRSVRGAVTGTKMPAFDDNLTPVN
jgi:hypothetical protein